MSATLNEQKLRHYFGSRTFPSQLESPAPSLDVGHKKMKAASRFYYDELIAIYDLKHRAEATEAFYPEYDMEIKFDINVDIEDIDLINK